MSAAQGWKPSLNWLLVFFAGAAALRFLAPHEYTWIFLCACLAILPLAGWMGHATEHLAAHMGEGWGGLFNVTFGNAAELVIALMALRAGQHEVVKASLTGSLIGNILLVLGAAFLAGGLRHSVQRFHAGGARTQATLLLLAATGLVVPMAYHYLAGPVDARREADLSLEVSLVLLATYGLSLFFSLRTHKHWFAGEAQAAGAEETIWSVRRAVGTLLVATILTAAASEILVYAIEPAAAALGMTPVFVGVIVVAVIGNAAEHSTAILAAWKNRMDLIVGIAAGSSLQIALFVAPVLVLASYFVSPQPLNLVFTPLEVLAIALSVAVLGQIAGDGESNWLEGVLLLSVYALLALVFYFLPVPGVPGHPGS